MMTLVIATRNAHKVEEIRAILGAEFRLLTLNDFTNVPEVVEDAGTFTGNATKKAVVLAKWLACEGLKGKGEKAVGGLCESASEAGRICVLADDSGLEVDALGGAPGVHSARFAALESGEPGNSSSAENNAKLLRLLKDVPAERRTARFRCVIALSSVPDAGATGASPVCYADEAELGTQIYEGVCEGRITTEHRGNGGFGYDPLFVPQGYGTTFGELSQEIKNRLSHRARALAKLKQALGSNGPD